MGGNTAAEGLSERAAVLPSFPSARWLDEATGRVCQTKEWAKYEQLLFDWLHHNRADPSLAFADLTPEQQAVSATLSSPFHAVAAAPEQTGATASVG